MIGILTAVREELKPILKKMPSVDTESAGGNLFYRGQMAGKEVVLARSGMGEERARAAARLMTERFRPESILAVGFAGGLDPEVAPGDLVVGAGVFPSERVWSSRGDMRRLPGYAEPEEGKGGYHEPDPNLLAVAEQCQIPNVRIHTGLIQCAPHVVCKVSEKEAVRVHLPYAIALDMESHAIGESATVAGVPWLAVRAVTDGLEDSLPELVEPIRGLPCIHPGTGEVIPFRMALLVLLSPRTVPKLMRLGRRASLAARNLADFVESYIARLP